VPHPNSQGGSLARFSNICTLIVLILKGSGQQHTNVGLWSHEGLSTARDFACTGIRGDTFNDLVPESVTSNRTERQKESIFPARLRSDDISRSCSQ
jgi:hypothetical protein